MRLVSLEAYYPLCHGQMVSPVTLLVCRILTLALVQCSLDEEDPEYSEQQNCSHVWKFWIVHLIEDTIKCVKSYKYSHIWHDILSV